MLRGRPTYPLAYWTTTPSTRRLDDLGEVPKRRLVIECIRDRRDCFDGVGTTPLRVTQNATARGALSAPQLITESAPRSRATPTTTSASRRRSPSSIASTSETKPVVRPLTPWSRIHSSSTVSAASSIRPPTSNGVWIASNTPDNSRLLATRVSCLTRGRRWTPRDARRPAAPDEVTPFQCERGPGAD